MADEFFQQLFRKRQRRIQAADAAVAEAARLFEEAKTGNKRRLIRAAAKRCESAAARYREAALGLLAKRQFATAARYYSLAGDCEGARLNQERCLAVSTYWDDADSP